MVIIYLFLLFLHLILTVNEIVILIFTFFLKRWKFNVIPNHLYWHHCNHSKKLLGFYLLVARNVHYQHSATMNDTSSSLCIPSLFN